MTPAEILDQLIAQNLGKPVEKEDPSNLDQCFDWAFAYVDVLGIPRSAIRHLRAYEIWTLATAETRQYFDLIPNSPSFIPQKGDMPIFGTEIGPSGHVSTATGIGNLNTFQSADQNWNGHKYIEYITHSYGGSQGLLGVLRPKNQTISTQGGDTVDQNAINGQKAHLFDLIWIHKYGQINTNNATEQQVNDFNAWLDSNVKRAGSWDQLCGALKIPGDTNKVTLQQITDKLQPISRMAELEQIRDIAIKALS